jgi:hypothetical protein
MTSAEANTAMLTELARPVTSECVLKMSHSTITILLLGKKIEGLYPFSLSSKEYFQECYVVIVLAVATKVEIIVVLATVALDTIKYLVEFLVIHTKEEVIGQ